MPIIDGKTEGTRFAHDVEIYDPADGSVIASMATMALGITPVAEPDIPDVPTSSLADDEANADAINGILAALRAVGVLA